MARRRFQRGQLFERGTDRKVWVGRWREDVIVDGKISRRQVKEIIGTRNQYPTRKLALRALEQRLSTINDPSYRGRPTALFREFAEKWQRIVLTQHKSSTQAAMRGQIRCHLIPVFGDVQLKDMNGMLVQRFVSSCDASPKTVRNLIATLRTMWASAKTWEFVAHDPFAGLVLPKWDRQEQATKAGPPILGGHPREILIFLYVKAAGRSGSMAPSPMPQCSRLTSALGLDRGNRIREASEIFRTSCRYSRSAIRMNAASAVRNIPR
jgi:hypothetical protein